MLDCFGGGGSSLIACEKAGRHARLIELDPKYCDVIVQRWQEFTGGTASLNDDGRSYEEIAAEPLGSSPRVRRGGVAAALPRPVSG